MTHRTVPGLIGFARSFITADIKVVAILTEVDINNKATILNIAMAGDCRCSPDHAESLLCKVKYYDTDELIVMITTKIPCHFCALEIITRFQNDNFELHMPKLLDVSSKWYTQQVEGLVLLRDHTVITNLYD